MEQPVPDYRDVVRIVGSCPMVIRPQWDVYCIAIVTQVSARAYPNQLIAKAAEPFCPREDTGKRKRILLVNQFRKPIRIY